MPMVKAQCTNCGGALEVDDSKGILMDPKSDGGGDALQYAIGQLNAFTPLQLANYAATLANGGTHYRAALVDKIVSYDIATVYDEVEPEVLNVINISDKTLSAVKAGMLSVTEDGTGRATFGNYPIKVGGKTGTSEVVGKADHSLFVAFAPFENPQIAISVVIEHAGTSISGSVAKAMMDAYFFSSDNGSAAEKPFVVLD